MHLDMMVFRTRSTADRPALDRALPNIPIMYAQLPPVFRAPADDQPLDLTFEGFRTEAFEVLARLRAEPHVEQYRKEKEAFRIYVQEPFKRYRDDLVVNGVLPNGLPFETEKNVFSRILKNDFGAGGSHHHLWMAFYRPPRKRLTDLQLSHAIYPHQFTCGLYAGDYAKGLFTAARQRMLDEAPVGLGILNELIRSGYRFSFAPHVTKPVGWPEFDDPLDAWPEGLSRAKGIWVRRAFPRELVIEWGPELVRHALREQERLWPLYRFWAEAERG